MQFITRTSSSTSSSISTKPHTQHPAVSALASASSRIPKDSFANLMSSYASGIGASSFATSVPPSRAPSPSGRKSSSSSTSSPSSSSPSSSSRRHSCNLNVNAIDNDITSAELEGSAPCTPSLGLIGGADLTHITSRMVHAINSAPGSKSRNVKVANYEKSYSHLVSRHGLGSGAPCIPPVTSVSVSKGGHGSRPGVGGMSSNSTSSNLNNGSSHIDAAAGARAQTGASQSADVDRYESGLGDLENAYGIGFGQGVVLGGFSGRM